MKIKIYISDDNHNLIKRCGVRVADDRCSISEDDMSFLLHKAITRLARDIIVAKPGIKKAELAKQEKKRDDK